MSPNSSAVLGSVPRPRIGTASGTLAQMRVNGQVLGIALSGAIVATRLPVHLAELAVRRAERRPAQRGPGRRDPRCVRRRGARLLPSGS